jgi:hypothetical protein
MREAVNVSRAENKTSAKLKRIFPQLMLAKSGSPRSFPRSHVVLAHQMQQIRFAKLRNSVGLARFVDQQRKRDAGVLAKNPRVISVAQTDGCQRRAFVLEFLLMCAQLRDVLSAENSSIVPQKNNHRRLAGPQIAQPRLFPVGIRQDNSRKLAAQCFAHDSFLPWELCSR